MRHSLRVDSVLGHDDVGGHEVDVDVGVLPLGDGVLQPGGRLLLQVLELGHGGRLQLLQVHRLRRLEEVHNLVDGVL